MKIKESQLKEYSIGISKIKQKIKLLESINKSLKHKIEEEKTENIKLKTLLITKDERIKLLDQKMSDIENDKHVK